ncbi:BatD family protein [Bradyrhizobium ganzhouense]|uniref:BatD family protein n=1 Tax=Bradyrhizobium ganzhouense TaxID=1179767 RepID=UPI003CE6C97D
MRHRIIAVALLLAAVLPSQGARAQQAGTPEPIVQVTVDPPRVVVGQQATLRIVVLAPNYMTAPPELPGFQVRNAMTRQLQSVNTNEQRDGMTYAGVRFEYAIYPQEPGSYAIADQKVVVKYAAEPPTTRKAEIALPRVSVDAYIPDAAAGLRPFLSASGLTVEQAIKRSSDQLKAGDSVTRTVTIKAEGTPAMLLPPQQFAVIDGLALYPAQPALEDRTDGRTDVMTSTRVDSATYMLERSGEYELPAIDIRWWNVGSGKLDLAHLDAVPLTVAANPAAEGVAGAGAGRASFSWDSAIDLLADHWFLAVLAAVALALLGWIAPHAVRTIAAAHRRRREAYRRSEAFSFSQFRRAVRRGDARAVYFALLDWLPHLGVAGPDYSIEALKTAASDSILDRQIDAIERDLFAPQPGPEDWSRRQLLRRLRVIRRRSRNEAASMSATVQALPRTLNPASPRLASNRSQRLPAR